MRRILVRSLAGVVAASAFHADAAGQIFGISKKFGETEDAAMALDIEGDRLYGAAGDHLYVFDVVDPRNPRQVGFVAGLGGARQLVVQNGFAYVTAREYGLWIVDCTDPTCPRIRSRFDTCELATGVDIAGDVCFCGQRQNGVEFIDVSDPDRPQHIAMRKTGESQSVKYRNGYLYSGEWSPGKVTVFDASDMSNIRELTQVNLYGYGDGIWMQGDYLFAARGHHSRNRKVIGSYVNDEIRRRGKKVRGAGMGHGLDVFDISNPVVPKRVGNVDYPPFYARGLDMWTPRTSGDILISAQTHNGIFAVNIRDKSRPSVLDRWVCPDSKHPERPGFCIGSIAVGNGVVYAAVNGRGFYVIEAAAIKPEPFEKGILPKNPGHREVYAANEVVWNVWKPHEQGQCRGVVVNGERAYVACGAAGLYVIEIRPENQGFREIGKLLGQTPVFDVSISGGRLFTAEGEKGFGVYEMSAQGLGVSEVGRLPRISDLNRLALYVQAVDGKRVFCSDRHGVGLYDVSNDGQFRRRLRVGGCPGWDKYLMDRPIGRYMAYNAAQSSLKWIDLGNPDSPMVSTVTRENKLTLFNGISSFGTDKAIASGDGCYRFFEANEGELGNGQKWVFKELPLVEGAERINGIPRSDGRFVVFTSRIVRRAALYDFSDVQKPKAVADWIFSGNPDIAVFYKGKVLIPCGYEGLLLQK